MKKIIFVSALTLSTLFGSDLMNSVKSFGGSSEMTAESLGMKLADIVKEKSPETAKTAKKYCRQASQYQSMVGIADDGMVAKAIDICADQSMKSLIVETIEEKESGGSMLNSVKGFLGN